MPFKLYNALLRCNNFLPIKGRETQKLDGSVMNMSFHPETDTYIMGCSEGSIYMYNASSHELKRLKKCEKQVPTATFVDSSHYVFSSLESKKLALGTLENDNLLSFDSHNSDIFCLQNLSKRNLLLSGVIGGSVMIYRTDKLPQLRIFCSARAHLPGMLVFTAQSITINGKEYVITAGQEGAVKIWHLIKGRMRLLRVIWTEEIPYSVVYLEYYRRIAIASECNYVRFFSLPCGRLESTVYLSEDDTHSLFLMKEKNMIGVMSYNDSSIEFIQLGGAQKGC